MWFNLDQTKQIYKAFYDTSLYVGKKETYISYVVSQQT